jgi:hypothetical protein
LGLKILKFFYADPDPEPGILLTLDPGRKNWDMGTHPGPATLREPFCIRKPLTKSNPESGCTTQPNLGEVPGSGVLSYLICGEGPPGDLPEDEAEGVHVRRLEALEGGGDERLVQHLGGHVPPRPHSANLTQVRGTLVRTCVATFFFSRKAMVKYSVGDPDLHVFGAPGSGSISQRYGTGSSSGSGSFPFLIRVLRKLK